MNIIDIILFSEVDWCHFKHRIYKYTNYFFRLVAYRFVNLFNKIYNIHNIPELDLRMFHHINYKPISKFYSSLTKQLIPLIFLGAR